MAVALAAAGLALSATAAAASTEDLGVMQSIVDFVKAHKVWAPLIIFVLAFGESIAFVSLILPFWLALVAVGALFTGSWAEIAPIWIASSIGAALGDWLSYWLGYHYADKIFGMWPLSKHPGLRQRGHDMFEKWGEWAIWGARWSGPLRASIPPVAGAVKMARWKFQRANWASAAVWAASLLLFGDIIARGFDLVWPFASEYIAKTWTLLQGLL